MFGKEMMREAMNMANEMNTLIGRKIRVTVAFAYNTGSSSASKEYEGEVTETFFGGYLTLDNKVMINVKYIQVIEILD
jgi:hypothetical protein